VAGFRISRGLVFRHTLQKNSCGASQCQQPIFVVRATVSDPAKRAASDRWYSKEHLPDAVTSFGVEKAWRFWSISDPSLHQATYQFADQTALDRAMNGDDLKRLVADFNRDWPDITRTRELLVLAEEFVAG
jgi:hypothetical protein